MAEPASTEWPAGWTAETPPRLEYSLSIGSEADWGRGLRDYLEYRDLGLAAASNGVLTAQMIRRIGDGPVRSEWHCHDLSFQFFLVLEGSISLENELGDNVTLTKGGIGYQPPLLRHTEELSEDYVALEITAPAEVGTIFDEDGTDRPEFTGGGKPYYLNEADSDWVAGAGPRKFFEYRDLKTSPATDGRIHVQLIRTWPGPVPEEGTGWHYHTMSQIFVVFEGSAKISVEGHGTRHLAPGDAMCVPSGPDARHVVFDVMPDYYILEACIPSQYDTIPTEAPSGFE